VHLSESSLPKVQPFDPGSLGYLALIARQAGGRQVNG
jgi:hypothetical protein